ncbi:NAD kinase [Parvibium lacunae]|uniref:NAD kinase n=2 Tax=Parvibium lacunae TaxID=1888893 RepID=A0A368L522_9BURK|nr:NAD kinase [Parvibium lacunae]
MMRPTSSLPAQAKLALIGKYSRSLASTPNAGMPDIAHPIHEIASYLQAAGHQVWLDEKTAEQTHLPHLPHADLVTLGQTVDAAIVLGGDGTLLGIARQFAPYDIPLIGINQGRLGFMTDIPLQGWQPDLQAILAGQAIEERRALLEAEVWRANESCFKALALNDVVVSRGGTGGMIEVSVLVDGEPMTTLRADGLILATPTGSTAYALSAGGPILHPRLAGITLVPVAPHSLTNRPITLPNDVAVEMIIRSGRNMSVHFDMQSLTELQDGDRITIKRAQHSIRLLHPPGYDYFGMLRAKLHWSINPLLEGKAS